MVKESSYKNQFQVKIDTEKDTPKENNNSTLHDNMTWEEDAERNIKGFIWQNLVMVWTL